LDRIHLLVDNIATEVERLRGAGATFRNDVDLVVPDSPEGPSGNPIQLPTSSQH
jgi:hypothetical protein